MDPAARPVRVIETERTFTIGRGDPLPPCGPGVRPGPTREHLLRAVYYDTPDLLLVRHRITLRRREGGLDAGWHLKLPRPDGSRLELRLPLGAGPGRLRVPEQLVDEVRATLGEQLPTGAGGALVPCAVLRTRRQETDLLDPLRDRVLAQLCDDRVSASPSGRRWREVEVELVAGEGELLTEITEQFARHGGQPAALPSKLAVALGDAPARAEAGDGPDPAGPAADVVLAYLAEQVAVILGREQEVRDGLPVAVHKTRVATRRLRSTLRTFRRLLHRGPVDALREEVRWLAEMLGGPRDADVIRDRVLAALEALPPQEVVGPVPERVAAELDARRSAAHATLLAALDSPRYAALVDGLLELLAEPPWRGRADRPAADALPPLVVDAVERARQRREEVDLVTGEEQLHRVHEARKRAKAARYACEAVAPSLGEDAALAAATWEQVTEQLGLLQDSVVAIGWLHELADAAQAAGEPTYTYGELAGLERATHDDAGIQAGLEVVDAALTHRWPAV